MLEPPPALVGAAQEPGFTDLSAGDIQEIVLADMDAADSVTIEGEMRLDGEEMSFALSLNQHTECAGRIAFEESGSAEFIIGPKWDLVLPSGQEV